jgi:chemotaxis protein MotA
VDIATVIGLFFGAVLIVAAVVMGGSAALFVNVPSILIVVGGTLAATLIKFSLRDVIGSVGVAMKTFVVRLQPPSAVIQRITELAQVARKEGLLGLDGKDFGDEFLGKGMTMMIDGVPPEQVTTTLQRELLYSTERHKKGQNIFKGMGSAAPAFGMIGTLIGLVQMLAAMDDPSSIGPAMAVALLTTLYGAVIANLIALPLADKLALRSKEEALTRELTIAGVAAIQRGDHPRLIEEQLKVFLAPHARNEEPAPQGAPAAEPAQQGA